MSAPARPTLVNRNENFAELASSRRSAAGEHGPGACGDAVDGRDDRDRKSAWP